MQSIDQISSFNRGAVHCTLTRKQQLWRSVPGSGLPVLSKPNIQMVRSPGPQVLKEPCGANVSFVGAEICRMFHYTRFPYSQPHLDLSWC